MEFSNKTIFINLPVNDLEKSKRFYTQLGFIHYPAFTGKSQVCMAWSDQILVMLQAKGFFNVGNNRSVAEAKLQLSATFTIGVQSYAMVNEIIDNGIQAGGKEAGPMIDEGFMQVRAIEDLDGHIWSFIYLDIAKYNKTMNNG